MEPVEFRESNILSAVRQRKSAKPSDCKAGDFNPGQSGLDERTLAKLLGAPTLTTCCYRTNEFLHFTLERAASVAPLLLPIVILPLLVVLIAMHIDPTIRVGSLLNMTDVRAVNNKKALQFVFIVVTSCYALVFFAIVVDFVKVRRFSKTGGRPQQWKAGRQRASTMQSILLAQQLFSSTSSEERVRANSGSVSRSAKSESVSASHTAVSDSSNASSYRFSSGQLACDMPENSWWESYALLRMNLHCAIYLIKASARKFLVKLNSRRQPIQGNDRRCDAYLQRYEPESAVKLLVMILLIVAVVVIITVEKGFLPKPEGNPYKDLIIGHKYWNTCLNCYLQLHFVTLLTVATLVSNSPSHISLVGVLGNWLLTLMSCLCLQLTIIPRIVHLPTCQTSTKPDLDLFDVFTDLEFDTPLINSLGQSRPQAMFLLSSLVTAIIASALYQTRLLQVALGSVGTVFEWLLHVSPVESLVLLLSMFATQTKFLILIMPFLGKLTESELFCIFTLMLVQTPGEGEQYWSYHQNENKSQPGQMLHNHTSQTYMPQRILIRALLAFPLIILFSRIVYPLKGKFGIRASVVMCMLSLQLGRPFKSLGESLLHFMAYCIRSLCRYFALLLLIYCLAFLMQFALQTVHLRVNKESLDGALVELLSTPVALLADNTQFYPSTSEPLSHYITQRFLFPKLTYYQHFFALDRKQRVNRTVDLFIKTFDEITNPTKEIVVSGSLSWDTIVIFVAFTTECLHADRRMKVAFMVRGCIAALLIYAAMHNLLFLICEPRQLRNINAVGRDWIRHVENYTAIGNVSRCSEVSVVALNL